MEKDEALVELNKIYSELYSSGYDPVVWTSLTKASLKKIFPISYQDKIDCIESIQYSVTAPLASQDLQNRISEKGKSQASKYIIAFINEIEEQGMEKNPETKSSFWSVLNKHWAIISSIVLGAFFLGMYIGNTKFDKDKNDYYNQVLALSSDTTKNNETIRIKSKIINQMDSILNIKSDSIKQLMQENNAAYYQIGILNQKK